MANSNTYSLDLEASSSQHAVITDANQTGLDLTGDLTLEAWVKFESLPSSDIFTFISKWDGNVNGGAYVWDLQHDGSNYKFRWVHNNGTGNDTQTYTLTGGNIPTTGVWYHYAMYWDASAGDVYFYIGGIQVGSHTTGSQTSIQNTDNLFVIGARDDDNGGGTATTDYLNGLIDDVRVWNDIRTQAEIANNLGFQLVGNEANLVGYWKLNNGYTDETSNNNDLSAVGSPVFSTDVGFETVNDYSLDLDSGSSQFAYITDANQTGLDLTGDLTLEAWVKFESLPGNDANMTFAGKWDATSDKRNYFFYLRNNSGTYELRFISTTDGTAGTIEVDAVAWTPTTGVWYHLACVVDVGTNVTFYVNGNQQGSAQTMTNASIADTTSNFRIGADEFDGSAVDFLNGLIDDVRVWSDIRTQAEIANNRAKQLVGNEANLVGYWRLNNDYTDTTSNNNDLTASGSPVFSTTVAFGGEEDEGFTAAQFIQSDGLIPA